MAAGLTLLSAGEGYLSSSSAFRGYTRSSSSSKSAYYKAEGIDDMATGEQEPNSVRSPWIRLFKLFQNKNRADVQRRESTNSTKVKQKDGGGLCVETMAKARKNSREEDTKAKRNIYRRPSSRTISNPRPNRSVYETYSPQKYSRRCSDPVDDGSGSEYTEPECDEMLYNRVRRPRSRSVPAICQGAGLRRRSEQARRDIANKQTNFREDVSVVYYEEEPKHVNEKRLSKVSSKNVKINDKFEEDESSTSSAEHDSVDSEKPSCSSEVSSEQSPTVIINQGGTQSIDVPPSFNIGKNRQGIRLMIELDRKCLRKKTSVKAMSGGRTFIVVTYKCVPDSDTEVMEFSDRINLPVAIDPFSVKANVLKSGHLCIEAPLRKVSI